MEKRIAKVFLDVRPGTRLHDAIAHARDVEGCDFVCFNDRLYPTDTDVSWEETPVADAWYLRDVGQWRERKRDNEHAKGLDDYLRSHRG